MIFNFNDFLILENFINDKNFSILNEDVLNSKIDNSIKFGIVVATYKLSSDNPVNSSRSKYTDSVSLLSDCINSIKNQTYKNWHLYIIGDAYEGDDEVKELLNSLLNTNQYTYYNLSKPGERNSDISSEELRYVGGVKAANKGISLCISDGIAYIARIDHDDKWKPNHLEILAKAYTQYDDLAFVFTKARKKINSGNSNKKYLVFPENKYDLKIDNKGYVSGETAHASVSWNTKLVGNFKYRGVNDQKNKDPKNEKTMPADVDMFRRMMSFIKENGYHYIYIPKLTTLVRNRKGKF